MRAIIAVILCVLLPALAAAEESALQSLTTADETRGWEAVGRINLGKTGFCTGTLISPTIVLTAAHCLYDPESGVAYPVAAFEFLAGWRNGRASAYRGVKRAVAHPDYVYEGRDRMDRVAYDLAFLELDQPIRLPSIRPFETGGDPGKGDAVGIVSYALDRSEAPSLQQTCHVLGRQPGVLVLSCSVDFGSSGAPIFSLREGKPEIVSVVSAKAEMDGKLVALGTAMEQPLAELRARFAQDESPFRSIAAGGQLTSGRTGAAGAKFIRP